MSPEPFRDNAVVVTGASRGIGREMALQLAEQGAWLALAAREAGTLEEVAAECRRRGGRDEQRDLSVYDRMMRVNHLGSAYCTWHALPHLKIERGK